MTDSVELKGVLEAALSEDGGIILIRNAMAEYQSHKKVHAAVISEVHPCDEHGNFMIDITNPLYDGITIPYMVTHDMVARFTPGVGDYIVLYENNYVSFSPKDVFEGGYLMIEWPSVCASEEDAEMEREIQTLGLTAPRVTPDQIDALMRGVRYEVQVVPGTTTTLATAIAANGFTLAIGMTACADPANFNADLGAKHAIKDAEAKARQELWKLEGWRLKCHLEEMSGPRVGGATPPIISTRIAVAEGEIVVCSVGENEQQHQVAVESAKKQYLSRREARPSERF
ncbi:Gp49 family protein [Aeromonas caviae]|uniref:Gp49 family protein n=1 Tax=Aeromonas caviae TaxID=648 RepID=UPI00388F24E0